MRQYEVTFIVDPVLAKNEIQEKANKYVSYLKDNGCEIVHIDEMGLRQLKYPIKKRNSGVYYCVEFRNENGKVINGLELTMRRDEELLRFLTVHLDKFGIKYNEDKRNGLIGKAKVIVRKEDKKDDRRRGGRNDRRPAPASKPVEKKAAPAEKKAAPVAEKPAPVVEKAAPAPEPVVAAPVAEAPAAPAQKDDLKKIEGIGPKIASLLNDDGIMTFAQLAAADVDKVKGILAAAGSRFTMHDPTTWGQQAGLAAEGKWDELKKWQDELDGGKATSDSSEEE